MSKEVAPFVYEGRDLEAMSFAPRYHEWILDHFEPFVGSYLTEIGAGTGTFSKIVLDRFKKPLCMVEPSKDMIQQLKARLTDHQLWASSKAIQGFTFELPDIPTTDTFFYVNVLEHIEDDQAELNWMHEHLQPGGHACIFSPAMPSLFGSHDERVAHFRRYTKEELVKKAQKAGFEIKKAIYFDFPGVPLWWLNFVVLKTSMNPGAVSLYDNIAVPILRLLEPSRILPFGKNILLVGKKLN